MNHPAPASVLLRAHRWNIALDGQRLRQLRRQHGLSQEHLAAKAGISPATVARLEPDLAHDHGLRADASL